MDFSRLSEFIRTAPERWKIPSLDCSVYVCHREVFRERSGFSDAAGTRPASDRDLYFIHSSSKVALAVASMQLVEQGLISLQDPVSEYLPEFGAAGVQDGNRIRPCRNPATLEHLLSMQAGLDYQTDRSDLLAFRQAHPEATTREVIRCFLGTPLRFEPGTHYRYSMCHDVMAAVIEAVTGMRYRDYVEKHIAAPLGIRDLYFHPGPEIADRMVQQYLWHHGPDPFDPAPAALEPLGPLYSPAAFGPNYDSAGGGIISSVSGYVLLADALANGGIGRNGARILKESSIDEMRRDRLARIPTAAEEFPQFKTGYGYGLGVRTLIDPSFSRSPKGEFGWNGVGGSYLLADPENRIAIFAAMSVLHMFPLSTVLHTRYLRDLAYEGIFA